MDLITIGIPCFNAQETILRAVNSAANQDWERLEILVVDDASSDNSPSIVANLAERDPRIRLIRQSENVGVGAIRNLIVRESRGDWIAFFDDDDASDPKRVRLQRQRIIDFENESDAKLILCFASGNRSYSNGYVLDIEAIGSRPLIPGGPDVADYLLFNHRKVDFFYGRGTPASALLARKSTFLEVGNFDQRFRRVEDSDLAIRVALMGGSFVGCQQALYFQTATLGTDKTPTSNFIYESLLIEKHKDYLVSRNRYEYAKHWFQFRFYHFNKQRNRALWELLLAWKSNPMQASIHFFRSAPKRLIHERRMHRGQKGT